ncbi:MAG: DUF4835 family protein [Cryomorphaceae bacterium]|nr:DUF4835 family protein [Cryomorphaceae bacterium]
MKSIVLHSVLWLAGITMHAQEFFIEVKVQAPEVQTNDRQVFTQLEQVVRDLVNNRAWTEGTWEQDERIRGSLVLTIRDYDQSSGQMSGNLQVSFARPVYGADYNSTTLNFQDPDLRFRYRPNEIVEFQPNQFQDLPSLLGFYAYLALGLDEASFDPQARASLLSAMQIAQMAQASGAGGGWDRFTSTRNRFWLIEDLLNPANEVFLQSWYRYHREGMDRIANLETQLEAKRSIIASLKALQPIHTRQPNIYLLRWFFDSKSVEIQQIFSGGPTVALQELMEVLQVMDASNASKYLNMGKSR